MIRKQSLLFMTLLAFGAFILSGCSKSKDGGNDDIYFEFKVNGQKVDYNNTVRQGYYPGTTSVNTTTQGVEGYTSIISATADINQVLQNAVSVVMTGPSEFTTNVNYTTGSNSGLSLMQFGYYDNAGKLYVMSNMLNLVNNPGNATVRYTVINDDILEGTFNAHLYDNTLSAHVEITEGAFRVKRKQ